MRPHGGRKQVARRNPPWASVRAVRMKHTPAINPSRTNRAPGLGRSTVKYTATADNTTSANAATPCGGGERPM